MSDLQTRIKRIEQRLPPALTDAERVAGWQRLIGAGNPRAIELYEIAKQRRDAARGEK